MQRKLNYDLDDFWEYCFSPSFSHCLRMKLQLYSRTDHLHSPLNLLILPTVSLLSLPSLQPLPSTWHTCHSLFITFYDLLWPLSLLIMFSLHVMLSPLLHLSNFYSSFNSKLKCHISFLLRNCQLSLPMLSKNRFFLVFRFSTSNLSL